MEHRSAYILVVSVCTALMTSVGPRTTATAVAGDIDHRLEIGAGLGAAMPAPWYNTSRNQSVGVNLAGSVLTPIGLGLALGVGGDWTRLRWDLAEGPGGHVDTWIVGPEVRYTDHHLDHLVPSAYVGAGWGGVSPSRHSSCNQVAGGPAARAGLGLGLALSRRWQIGLSLGVVLQPRAVAAGICDPAQALIDPGAPEAPGNIWGLRISCMGDLL